MVSREEFKDWKDGVVAKDFFKWLLMEAHIRRLDAGSGGCMKDSFLTAGEAYVRKMLEAQVFELIPEVEYEDIYPQEDNNEDNSKGAQSTN